MKVSVSCILSSEKTIVGVCALIKSASLNPTILIPPTIGAAIEKVKRRRARIDLPFYHCIVNRGGVRVVFDVGANIGGVTLAAVGSFPNRVMKEGQKSGNRSDSEAKNPTIFTPNGVFSPLLELVVGSLVGRRDYPENTHHTVFDYASLSGALTKAGFREGLRRTIAWYIGNKTKRTAR